MKFIIEFKKRWNKESPAFFVKVTNISLWLIGTGTSLSAIPALINATGATDIDLSFLLKLSSYMIVAGTSIGIVAKTTVKDINQI